MGRYPKIDVRKGAWSEEESQKLAKFIKSHGLNGIKWGTIANKAGLNRCPKSCRLRWKNYLNPNIRRGNFSEEEELLIIRLHSRLGNKWSRIAAELPGRTDNDIKNFWNTKLKKKLIQKKITEYSSHPQTPDVNDFLANNYLIMRILSIMPQLDVTTLNLLMQELEKKQQEMFMASIQNNLALPDSFSTILRPDYGIDNESAIMFDSSVIGMCSNNDNLTEHCLLPELVSTAGDEIPMPMTDEICANNLNSIESFEYERIVNEMNYESLELGSAIEEDKEIFDSCARLFSSSFTDDISSLKIYDGASCSSYAEFQS